MQTAIPLAQPPDPSSEEQHALYRTMLLIRRFDELVLEMRLAGEVDGVVHPYLGQEAIATGVCSVLRDDDALTSTHRGHGHCIAKGADPRRMMAELLGRRDGYCAGKGGSMHIADFKIGMLGANGIVAAGMPIAAGAALAATLTGSDSVAVSMFGDGAVGAGPFHETMNIAALWKLPLILVCENNGYAVGTAPEQALSAQSVAALAEGYGTPGEIVDGNDVLAMRSASWRAVERARAGEGPTLLEARTFRISNHAYRGVAAPDTRDPDLIAGWVERDAVAGFRRALIAEGTLTDSAAEAIAQSVEEQLADARRFGEESPYPDPEEALEGLFAA